jgi:hypothetical protein
MSLGRRAGAISSLRSDLLSGIAPLAFVPSWFAAVWVSSLDLAFGGNVELAKGFEPPTG